MRPAESSPVFDDLFERPFDRRTKRGLSPMKRRLARIVALLIVIFGGYAIAVIVASVS